MDNKLFILRIIATMLVLCSLVLPLSRCERKPFVLADENGSNIEGSKPVTYTYKYAKDWFSLKEWPGWLALLSFSWPPLLLLLRWCSKKIRKAAILPWLEMVLCLGSGYVIWAISSFGERLIGAYVALAGIGLYLITAVNLPVRQIIRRIRKE